MTSVEFVNKVAEKGGYSKKETRDFIKTMESVIYELVGQGEKFKVADLSVRVDELAARDGINLQTKEPVRYSATKVVKIKAAKGLKAAAKQA